MKQGFFEIIENTALTDTVFRMRLRGDTSAITAPGQFVNILLDGLFLRRPISVCDCEGDILTLIYKVVGAGTEQMAKMGEGETLDEDGVSIRAFGVCHDSRACLGYRIEYTEGDESVRIGIATDIGHLTCEVAEGLLGCDYVIVESNHDPEMLKTGPYPDYLKVRIFSPSGHLQNESCAKLCSYLSKLGTHGIMLAHISKENNDPALALKLTEDAVANGAVTVRCARPDTPVCLYESNNCTERLSECSR